MMNLSVAIPTYGQSKYLHYTLNSIQRQSVPVQCTVCAGGNEFLPLKEELSWVNLINLNPDPGMNGCWSMAANQGNAAYISFLADDNEWEDNFAQVMTDFAHGHPECDIIFCNQYVMNEDGIIDRDESLKMTKFYGRDKLNKGLVPMEDYTHLIKSNSIPLESCIIKRSTWQKYGPFANESKGALDLHFFLKLLVSGNIKIGFIPEYLTRFRIHSNSYSQTQQKLHSIGAIWSLENLISSNNESNDLLQEKLMEYRIQFARMNISTVEKKEIIMDILKSRKQLYFLCKYILRSGNKLLAFHKTT